MDENIQINKEVLITLLEYAKIDIPKVLNSENIATKLFEAQNKKTSFRLQEELMFNDNPQENNVLVIDDIGVVTYQLRILLENAGYNVQVAKDIYNGINKFIKYKYVYVIMDLFVSTEQEGFILLNETKKIIAQNNLDTKIIVITASTKAENRIKCLNCGADEFLRKEVGWQDKLLEIVKKKDDDFNTF